MKLPSIHYLIQSAKRAFIRFPLTIISSLVASILGIYLVEKAKEITNLFPYINIMLCMSIGIPLFFCVTTIAQKKQFDKKNSILLHLLATAILVIIYFTLPNAESTHNTSLPYIKYTLYNITCHLMVSFIPFVFNKQLNGFWNYNKILFIRIWASILYSGFIYAGLIIALTSLRLLFDINIHEKLYADIWIATICFFNTWFFVGGIPADIDQLENDYEYPKGLKIFSQYVLLPLLGLYLIILYSYGTKILVLWDWPRGIVSYLIICVSVLGILAFLLLHPYGNHSENSWIKKAAKGYYLLLFPLLVVLFIAIFMRINEYGITINRYVILILGIWLTIVCVYTAIGNTNIKFIPTSLAILAILISFGPWGMFSISEKSQVNRLKTILEQANILVNNKVVNETIWIKDSLPNWYSPVEGKNKERLPDSLHREVQSIINYLDDHHGFSSIKAWYMQDIDSLVTLQHIKEKKTYQQPEAVIYMKALGLDYTRIYAQDKMPTIAYRTSNNGLVQTVTGYDYIVNFDEYNYENNDTSVVGFTVGSVDYQLLYLNKPNIHLLLKTNTSPIYFELDGLIKNLQKEFGINPEFELPTTKMQLMGKNDSLEVNIEFRYIDLTSGTNGLRFNRLSGVMLIKRVKK
ncbi:MAG: DUF4153 domain-containing protein [Bacteroidetes bacterium]|nr:MAG: DUF4153 domain-containing protein [Bacteroidota bacterium]